MPTSYIVDNPFDLSISSQSWQNSLAQPTDTLVIQPYWGSGATLAKETEAVVDLIEYAQLTSPNVEVFLFWSWPWQDIAESDPGGWSGYWNSPYGSNPDAGMIMTRDFFEQLHEGVASQTTADVRPVPVGEVMDYMRQSGSLASYYGNTPTDNVHLNSTGEYIPSATLAASLFGLYDVPLASGFFSGLTEPDRQFISDAISTVVPIENWRFGDQDMDGDSDTDLADLLSVQRRDHLKSPQLVAVPESTSLATLSLLALCVTAGLRGRPSRRSEPRLSFRTPQRIGFAGCFGAAAVLLLSQPMAWSNSQPNIVLIVADDAGYADFGFMDQLTGQTTEFMTPNIDQLASESVVMERGYVTSAACSQSRAGLLTGRYQQRFGFEQQIDTTSASVFNGMPTDEVMLTERMKQLGYTTGAMGKWHQGVEINKQPQNQGVDHFFGMLTGGTISYFGNEPQPLNQIRRNTTIVDWQNEPSFNGIAPDPVKGRELTDALGDEASEFVANNAGQQNPFFLYLPHIAPHSPYHEAKSSDLAQFDGTSLAGERKNVAALTYSLDRAIGNLVSTLKDPNGDGNQSDSVYDNTIIAFVNDNGGRGDLFSAGYPSVWHDNGPLLGVKATNYEGGIRVPYFIKMPGVAPGTFDQSVSTLDLYPTFVAAAGGQMTTPTDGVDLRPHLTGQQTGAVHEYLFWRGGENRFAVTKGEFKLAQGFRDRIGLYKLNPDGSGETVDVKDQYPAVFQELKEAFVDWETELEKPTYSEINDTVNRFDSFVFRPEVRSFSLNMRISDGFHEEGNPSNIVQMQVWDSYPNLAITLPPHDPYSYTLTNNLGRSAGFFVPGGAGDGFEETMLNELRLAGDFSGTQNRSAEFSGLPLMFVNSLAGAPPKLRLQATRSTSSTFRYKISSGVVLYDHLTIDGDSELQYEISGAISDFKQPQGIDKLGTSTITFSGYGSYRGPTNVLGGTLRIAGQNAALDGTSAVTVASGAELVLSDGLIHTDVVTVQTGGAFDFQSGTLETDMVVGDLTQKGGLFKAGSGANQTQLDGDYTQLDGVLQIEVGGDQLGTEYDQLMISGAASLAGDLEVLALNLGNSYSPLVGDMFNILSATGGLTGVFGSVSLPDLLGDQFVEWNVNYLAGDVMLEIAATFDRGDYDRDGDVDSVDLATWDANFGSPGTTFDGDSDGDGDVDLADLLVLQQNFTGTLNALVAVPEPTAAAFAMAGLAACFTRRRR
ncbi:MAG: sulfatase-like hydrolase/transferase [Planctomycetota bacterium]